MIVLFDVGYLSITLEMADWLLLFCFEWMNAEFGALNMSRLSLPRTGFLPQIEVVDLSRTNQS